MHIEQLLLSGKTVFTIRDILLFLGTQYPQTVSNFIQRMKKKGILHLLCHGIWALSNYDPYELSAKLKKNSYISCETVLKEASIIFQYYGSTITAISDNTITKKVDGRQFIYRKISDTIRLVPEGIIHYKTYSKACPERALCDMIYLSPTRYCDDVSDVDRSIAEKIASYYPQRVVLTLRKMKNDGSKTT